MAKETLPTETQTQDGSWDDVPVIDRGIGEIFRFDNIGDVLIGKYLGIGNLDTDDGEAKYHRFETPEGVQAVSASYDLSEKLREVGEGQTVRMEYVKNTPTKRGQTDMKVFRVQAKF